MFVFAVGMGLAGCGGFAAPEHSVRIIAPADGGIEITVEDRTYTVPAGQTKTVSYAEKTKIKLLATAGNDDYIFSYWDIDGGWIAENPLMHTVTADAEIRAVFSDMRKTVTVVDGDGNTVKEFLFFGKGLYDRLQTEVTETGYDYDFAVDGKKLTGGNSPYVTKDLTVVATKRLQNYSIAYDLGGGEIGEANPTAYSIESAAITLTNPTRWGYTFAGWTGTALNGATMSVTVESGSTGDRNYLAHWNAIDYRLSYDLCGGELSTPNPTVYNADFASFDLNNPTKTGYDFAGWSGTGLSVPTFNVIIASGSTGDRSYSANWSLSSYPIAYELNGGEVGSDNPLFYNMESVPITLTNPTRKGYTFAGWTGTGLDAPSSNVRIETGSMGYRRYEANWNVDEYTVTFKDAEDGSVLKSEPWTVEMPKPAAPTFDDEYYVEIKVGGIDWDGYDITESPDSEVEVAVTKKAAYRVTLKNVGGFTADGSLKKYKKEGETITFVFVAGDEAISFKNTSPYSPDSIFLFWSDGTSQIKAQDFVIDTTVLEHREYTAVWGKYLTVQYTGQYDSSNDLPTSLIMATDDNFYEQVAAQFVLYRSFGDFAEMANNAGNTDYYNIGLISVRDVKTDESVFYDNMTPSKHSSHIMWDFKAIIAKESGRNIAMTIEYRFSQNF